MSLSLPDLTTPLLNWYDHHARVLPWRSNPTPYRVWVSEIMLQQTRVDTATPYFERFVQALPDAASLADASEEQLHKLWEGLGYYSRVRNMAAAAKIILNENEGRLPDDPVELEQLPGIGPYTAGAIASIAYGRPAPAVDGNVLRVITRLCGDDSDIRKISFRKAVAAALRDRIPPDRAGDFTQALMELGALVCTPGAEPSCSACPLKDLCAAFHNGRQADLPARAKAKPVPSEKRTVLLVTADGQVLLRRRPDTGLLAGLWEFPNKPGTLSVDDVAKQVADWDGSVLSVESAGTAKHRFSHRIWDLSGWHIKTTRFSPPEGFVWATRDQLRDTFAVPTAFRVYTDWMDAFFSG